MASKYISDKMAGAIGLIAALIVLLLFLSGSERTLSEDPIVLFIILMAIVNAIFFSTVLIRD